MEKPQNRHYGALPQQNRPPTDSEGCSWDEGPGEVRVLLTGKTTFKGPRMGVTTRPAGLKGVSWYEPV